MKKFTLLHDINWWYEYEINNMIKEIIDLPEDEEIHFLINTNGGDVYLSMAIYSVLKRHKGKVVTEVLGKALSGGAMIFLAGDEKRAYENSTIMLHRASQLGYGNYMYYEEVAEDLKRVDNMLINNIVGNTEFSKEEVIEKLNKDWYMYGSEEILASGIKGISIIDEKYIDEDDKKEELDNKVAKKVDRNKKVDYKKIVEFKNRYKFFENLGNSGGIEQMPDKNKKVTEVTFTEEEVASKVNSAISGERERISKILNLSKIEVPENVAKAINESASYKDFAVSLVESDYFENKVKEEKKPEVNITGGIVGMSKAKIVQPEANKKSWAEDLAEKVMKEDE